MFPVLRTVYYFQALEMLPANTEVKQILTYLENVMEEKAAGKRSCQVLKSLLYAENLQVSRILTATDFCLCLQI